MSAFIRLLLLATCLLASAGAARAASPACALLSRDAAANALGGTATMKDGGAERDGYSDCAWNGPDGAVLSVLFWSAARFADGHASAAEKYELLEADLKRRGASRPVLDDLADDALLVDESSPGFQAAGIVMLKGGQIAQLSGRGITVAAALQAAGVVARQLAAAPADERVVPRPKPAAITVAAPPEEPPPAEPVPQPEPAPIPAEPIPEPAPVTPPVAEPQPEPVPPPVEPQPEPTPEPVTPPVAEPLPEPVLPPAEPQPEPTPEPVAPPVEPVPEPVPEPAPPIRPTAEPDEPVRHTGSPACPLLPAQTLEALLPGGAFRMEDRGPAENGESNCRWSRTKGAMALSLTLLEGAAIAAAAPDAAAYFDELEGPGPDNGTETLAGVGERAYLQTLGEGDYASFSLSILAHGKIVFLNLTGTGRDAAIKLGLAVASKM